MGMHRGLQLSVCQSVSTVPASPGSNFNSSNVYNIENGLKTIRLWETSIHTPLPVWLLHPQNNLVVLYLWYAVLCTVFSYPVTSNPANFSHQGRRVINLISPHEVFIGFNKQLVYKQLFFMLPLLPQIFFSVSLVCK